MATTHGMSKHELYKTWVGVRNRCNNPKDPYFHNYGGRGVKMHPAWEQSFAAFLEGVGKRPSPQYSLDRVNNNGNYEPGNVRWLTKKQQAHNMRKNRLLTHNGRTQALTAWAEEMGLVPSTLQYRLKQGGMSVEEAVTTPRRNGRRPRVSSHDSGARRA